MKFAAVDSILDSDSLGQWIAETFPAGDPLSVRLHARGVNDTYRITTPRKTFYFRVYRLGSRTESEIRAEQAILWHLASHGRPVSTPVASRRGKCLIELDCPEGKRLATLFTEAPGVKPDYHTYRLEQVERYGKSAAAIHHAMRDYTGPRDRKPIDLEFLLHRPLTFIRTEFGQRKRGLEFLDRLGKKLEQEVAARQLPVGFVHGDLHGQNASLLDGVFTFYDFDFCGWGFRGYDLATLPWVYLLRNSSFEQIERFGNAFLRGYRSVRPLTRSEIESRALFVTLRQIWYFGLQIELAPRSGWQTVDAGFFDRHLNLLQRWCERYPPGLTGGPGTDSFRQEWPDA